jgi:DNA-binding MarR family transcriptional regulator
VVAPRFPDQPDFIGRLLRDLWGQFVAETTESLQQGHPGLSQSQTRVMTLIDREGTRPAELARRAQMTRQSMTEALNGLHAAGLVALGDDPTDRRAKVATLTPAGARGLRDGLEAALRVHARWAEVLGERKMHQLLKLLRELADAI